MRLRRLLPVLAAAVAAPLIPGTAHAAPATTAVAPSSATASSAAPAAYTGQKPDWKRCFASESAAFQCAQIKVPLDYRAPHGRTIEVGISRLRTSTPGKRHGVMLFNPGGPGGTGLKDPLIMAKDMPRSVLERFDLIGMDPRGLGRSSPLSCGTTPDEQGLLHPYKPASHARDVARAKRAADKCRTQEGDVVPHITTRNTARDMDVIRAVLGEKKISYLGVSYGTYLGAVYTQMFPQRADRFVLDSAVDPKRAWRGMIQVWAEEAGGAFDRWSAWTARRHASYGLGETAAEVRRTYWDLVARADREPVVVGGASYTGDDVRMLRHQLFEVRKAAQSITTLHRASLGVPGGVMPAEPEDPNGPIPGSNETTWSVICGDDSSVWPRDPERYAKEAARDKKRYPLFGDFTSSVKPCAFWPKSVEPVTVVNNKVPSLVIQNEWDSQTPLSTAQGMHKALKGSRLVTVEGGEGHGIYNYTRDVCALKATNDYLATGRLPAKNVVCQAADDDRGRRGPASAEAPRSELLWGAARR